MGLFVGLWPLRSGWRLLGWLSSLLSCAMHSGWLLLGGAVDDVMSDVHWM